MASDEKPEANMLWGGHFSDILGIIAFARANQKRGILTADEFQKIESGLQAIVPGVDEECRLHNERRLSEVIGKEVVGKLHTGRSRNEQVAYDMRMWLRDELRKIEKHLATFLQRAQPSSLRYNALTENPFGIDRDMMAAELRLGVPFRATHHISGHVHVELRSARGGTSKSCMLEQITALREILLSS
ncbi:argininosuccinate lyase [Xylaria flabelliformis]|nr:argininosuccinate lyase [Xylaria flabelliformis]